MKTKLTKKDQEFVKENLHLGHAALAEQLGVDVLIVSQYVADTFKPSAIKPDMIKGATVMTPAASAEGDKFFVNEKGELQRKTKPTSENFVTKKDYKCKIHD